MDAAAAVAGVHTVQAAFQVLSALSFFKDLWPKNAVVSDGEKFDFIVVGAGTAGCVVANRLSKFKNISVLLIEAGGDPPIESVRPGLFSFLRQTKVDWNYTSENDGYTARFHKNQIIEVTRGKMLGGSSSMNFMAYTRGNSHDYNIWANITDDPSWSYKNILPYFKKSEKLLSQQILQSENRKFHGENGSMKVTKPCTKQLFNYLNAFKEVGNDINVDTNGANSLGYMESTVNIADGKRQSAALAFLSTAKDRENLHVLKNALVTKIIFDEDKKAIGVEIALEDKTMVVYVEREVIVAGGAINSPQLLMLSGIGPEKHLKKHNIPVIKNLPVGQEMKDHVLILMIQKMKRSKEASAGLDPDKQPLPLFIGYVALNKSQGYPDYQTLNFVLQDSQTLLQLCAFYFSYTDKICQDLFDKANGFELLFSDLAILYPKSCSKVLLRSSNPRDPPLIYTNYYSNPDDLENHAKYVEDFLGVSETDFFRNAESEFLVPKTCGCKRSDIEFFKCYALCMMSSGYHFSGSIPMGSVLDSRLRVHGVENLRVVDASVMPTIPGANTHAPTLMVGERGADFIMEDHGFINPNHKC